MAHGLHAVTEIDVPIFEGGFGTAFFEESARRFEALRPGVKVNLYGDPRIWDKVRVRVLSGDYPDATTAALYWPNLIRAGRLLDLTPYLNGPSWEETGAGPTRSSPGHWPAGGSAGAITGCRSCIRRG